MIWLRNPNGLPTNPFGFSAYEGRNLTQKSKKENPSKWMGFLLGRDKQKKSELVEFGFLKYGGDNRTRTCDLMRVKHAL